LSNFYRFYWMMAMMGAHQSGRYCPVNEAVKRQPTRLGASGVWLHFDNIEEWHASEAEGSAEEKVPRA
jgi:hypothetical protein